MALLLLFYFIRRTALTIVMAINTIPIDPRVIDIDSRRFASVEKALVELITNSDDSYSRLEKAGVPVSGRICIHYERHMAGAMLVVADQGEGMFLEKARHSLTYGGAHSSLARGEGGGRGYFGRGLKQAIYGMGYGWIETIQAGRYARIDLFRGEDGGYLYDDGEGDRPAKDTDYARLGVSENGTRVAIVVDNPQVNISQYRSIHQSIVNNIYLREMLERRQVELVRIQQGRATEHKSHIRFEEPPATVLMGPDQAGQFTHDQTAYPFTLTLKRAQGTELTLRGDERTNGLLVLSGVAILDCQFFNYENQVGTEYLFGTVNCPALIEKLGQGMAIISDEREGLNKKEPFVAAFFRAVTKMITPAVMVEREKLKHLDHATASGRTSQMIEHLLGRMNRAAVQDLHIALPHAGNPDSVAEAMDLPAALRFTTPFYYRKPKHPFHVSLLVDPAQLDGDDVLHVEYGLSDNMQIEPSPKEIPIDKLADQQRFVWTVTSDTPGDHGEISVRSENYWAWCELVVSDHASGHTDGRAHPGHQGHSKHHHTARHALARDHGETMFIGYDFRNLGNDLERAVYSPEERKIIINTGAPTVQLYVDGRGRFRDSARLLLAELFMNVISNELARHIIEKSGQQANTESFHAAKMDIIRRYGNDIHLSFFHD